MPNPKAMKRQEPDWKRLIPELKTPMKTPMIASRFTRLLPAVAVSLFLAAFRLGAQEVVVSKSGGAKISLDLAGFSASGAAGSVFRQTLESDLRRSGWFVFSRPATYGITGQCADRGGSLSAQCQVASLAQSQVVLNKAYADTPANARHLAHKVADEIIMAIKGFRGICSGRIVMVGNRTGNKEVYLCDFDGGGLRQVTTDRSISLAPYWSASGTHIAYTSFRRGYPDIYLVDLRSGARNCIADYPGINMAGGLSPRGNEALMILSKDGNPEVYMKDLGSGRLTRLTHTPRAGEASPVWSPDGSQIAYVSDLAGAGSPQVYIMNRSGNSKRITSRGRENVAPDWGANGWITFCSRRGGRYGIFILHPATLEERQVSPDDTHYEDPAWCSDGRHIVCTRQDGRTSRIYMLDTMGDPPVCLTPNDGSWFSPSWCAQ